MGPQTWLNDCVEYLSVHMQLWNLDRRLPSLIRKAWRINILKYQPPFEFKLELFISNSDPLAHLHFTYSQATHSAIEYLLVPMGDMWFGWR